MPEPEVKPAKKPEQQPENQIESPVNHDHADAAADKLAASSEKESKTEKPIADIVPQDFDARMRTSSLQTTLASFLPAIRDFQPKTENPEKEFAEFKTGLQKDQEALNKERERGVFGPATAKAFKEYKDWLEAKAVPSALITLDAMQLPIPDGCPLKLPADKNGRSISPELFKAITAGGDKKLDLKIGTSTIPSEADLKKLDDTFSWIERSQGTIQTAKDKLQDEALEKLIKNNGLPKGWLEGHDKDPAAWRASASEMIDLSLRTRNYIEAMQALFKDTQNRWGEFPVKFPPGTKVTVDYNGQEKVLTDSELNDPSERYYLKNGKIKNISLDLPEDLRQDHPANAQKIERMREWLKTNGEEIDKAVIEYSKAMQNPDAIIMFGDRELPSGCKVRLNDKGEFAAIVGREYVKKPGENIQPANLIGCDATTKVLPTGEIEVTQTVRAENAPPWAYLNARFLGVKRVGEDMKIDAKKYKPDDFVPVRDGEKIQLVQAKNLESFLNNQRLFYYGEKGLTLAMDTAMLVSGTIEVGAAVKAGRVAAAAATQGMKVAAKDAALGLAKNEVRWEMAKGLTRMGVAGAGVFNNAGARAETWGQAVNTGRGLYFLGDIGQGMLRGGWRLASGARAAENLGSAEKVHKFIHEAMAKGVKGETLVEGTAKTVDIVKATPFRSMVHTGTAWTFKATEIGFAPIIGGELTHQIGDIFTKQHDHLRDASLLVGDGRGTQIAQKGAFDMNKPEALKAAHQLLDGYNATMKDGRSPETQAKIQEIFDRTKALLDPKATDEQRKAYKAELMAKAGFSGAEIQKLESLFPQASDDPSFKVTAEQVHDLMDPAKRAKFPKAVREEAEKMLAQKDKDVDAAARMAMMYLSRDADGNVSSDLASRSDEIPGYKRTIYIPPQGESPGSSYTVDIPARPIEQKMVMEESVNHLRRDLESTDKGNRGIATGDTLLRMGGLTPRQYAGILQDVLTNPKSSDADKMRALCDPQSARFASMVDGVKKFEALGATTNPDEKAALLGRGFGLSSEALMKTLETSATSDKNPDVRAMSAALLYGLKEKFAAEQAAEKAGAEYKIAAKMAETARGQEKADWTAAATKAQREEEAAKESVKRSAAVLADLNGVWQTSQGKETGTFAKKVIEHFNTTLEKPISNNPGSATERQTKLNAALALAFLTDKDDTAAQLNITRAIAASFDPADPKLATQMISAMLPDRMKQLSDADPSAANELRQKIVDALKVPAEQETVAQVTALMEAAKPLCVDSFAEKDKAKANNFANQLAQKYREFLDVNTPKSADYSPEIRVNALLGLAQLRAGDPASVAMMRRHVTEQAKYKIGDAEIDAGETDARVRAAAIHALKTVNDKEFRNSIVDLIDKETDVKVAQVLRDARFSYQRPDRDSRDYKDMYEALLAKIEDPGKLKKYPFLKGWREVATRTQRESAADFLDEQFPLLNKDNMIEAAGKAAKQKIADMGNWDWFWSGKTWLAGQELDAIKGKEEERMGEFNKLCEMAKGGDENGIKAKLALAYLAQKGPEHTGRTQDELAYTGRYFIPGNDNYQKRPNPDFQKLAADALKDCCKVGTQGRDIVADRIKRMLEHGYDLRTDVLQSVLGGWRELGKAGLEGADEIAALKKADPNYKPKEFAMSREQYAATIARALQTELEAKNPADQNVGYQKALMNELKEFKNRGALHTLDALKKSPNADVRKAAEALVFELADSVKTTWDEATPLNMSEDDRATRIKSALGDKKVRDKTTYSEKSAESTVQEIFAAYKGYDLKGGDKGLPMLDLAMSENNDRVRMAAAMVLMKSSLDANDPVKRKAIKTLAEIATSNPTSGFGKDAIELLGPQKTAANINPLATAYAQIALSGGEQGKRAMQELANLPLSKTEAATLDDGKQVRARKTSNGVIVEELKDGKVMRAAVPEGKTHADFLISDAYDRHNSPADCYASAKEVLRNSQIVGASQKHREQAVRAITSLFDDKNFDEKLKLEAAKMVAVEKGLSDAEGKRGRELAFNAIADLAAHGSETKAEALTICTADSTASAIARDYTMKKLQDFVDRRSAPSEKVVEEKLNLLMRLADAKDPKSVAHLMDAAYYGSRLLNGENPTLGGLTSRLDPASGMKPLDGRNDERLPAIMRALKSDNPRLQESAAWLLMDKNAPKDLLDQRAKDIANNAINRYRETLSTRAAALEKEGNNREAATAWGKVEAALQHSGEDPASFAYTYATMKRMAANLGDKHKDLAPLYDRLADLAGGNQNSRQAEYFRQRSQIAKGQLDAISMPALNAGPVNMGGGNFGVGNFGGGNGGGFVDGGSGGGGGELGLADSIASRQIEKDLASGQEATLLKALDAQKKAGMAGPALAEAQRNLGEFYIAMNHPNRDLQKAKDFLEQSLQTSEQTMGRNADWAAGRARVAFIDARNGEYEASSAGYAEALGALRQAGGQQTPQYAQIYNDLAQQLQLHGKPGELDMFRNNLDAYIQIQKVKLQARVAGAGTP